MNSSAVIFFQLSTSQNSFHVNICTQCYTWSSCSTFLFFLFFVVYRDESTQVVSLKLINGMLPRLSPAELTTLLPDVKAFTSVSSIGCREVMYDIFIWIYDHYRFVSMVIHLTSTWSEGIYSLLLVSMAGGLCFISSYGSMVHFRLVAMVILSLLCDVKKNFEYFQIPLNS